MLKETGGFIMGLINEKVCYTYEDLTIKPCVVSNINHRIECVPFDKDGMLPLFAAPMDTVVNEILCKPGLY